MRLGIIGAGAWGDRARAGVFDQGQRNTVWAVEPEVVEAINERREIVVYLPGEAQSVHSSDERS